MFYKVTVYVGDMPTLMNIKVRYSVIKFGELELLLEKETLLKNKYK